jgi:hypothetical protein
LNNQKSAMGDVKKNKKSAMGAAVNTTRITSAFLHKLPVMGHSLTATTLKLHRHPWR